MRTAFLTLVSCGAKTTITKTKVRVNSNVNERYKTFTGILRYRL